MGLMHTVPKHTAFFHPAFLRPFLKSSIESIGCDCENVCYVKVGGFYMINGLGPGLFCLPPWGLRRTHPSVLSKQGSAINAMTPFDLVSGRQSGEGVMRERKRALRKFFVF